MRPLQLGANTIASFYSGDGRIGAFRRDAEVDPTHPEDWIASTTPRTGAAPLGLTVLPDGTLLADRFAADPEAWFGPDYAARYGPRGALLVKLLDAGRRLPLHVHPDRPFARRYLDSDFGKSEAWLVLHAEPHASAHLGFRSDVTAAELADWVDQQDVDALLANCNQVPLRTGDVLFCPGGVPHSIGDGVLILEIQEMTDFSIILEWAGFPLGRDDAFLGLAADVALSAVHLGAVSAGGLEALRGEHIRSLATGRAGRTSLLPPSASEFFTAEQIVGADGPIALEPRFAVLVVNEGDGTLAYDGPDPISVTAGQTYLVPYAAGTTHLEGPLSAVRCFPA